MSQFGKSSDDATTKALIDQMTNTDAACDAGRASVDATTAALGSNWSGGAASIFVQSVEEWKNGLRTVQQAIKDLGDAMGQKQRVNEMVESDNSAQAQWSAETPASWT
ncbi:WXG100 family type VII secretion target [Catenuloplanes sp. NPDC051500]|uniref:WXG100 family type VII secretion target n=1 Tax=Catenuloplanes sp. NPDC051500 TaxID=3363959 RepID=UPI003795CD51